MKQVLVKFTQALADAFWLIPAVLVSLLAGLGLAVVEIQARGFSPDWIPAAVVYGGGETGARTLLGAVASSSIAVAGTIFSVTLAALSLASNQLGPRLLRNFTQDRGNQLTLGVLLGTFAYTLMVLRSVRGGSDAFVPGLGVSVALLLAAWCIGMLVYFVHHIANGINVDTVISLVHRDLVKEVRRLDREQGEDEPRADFCAAGSPLRAARGGYLLSLDAKGLADWAAENGVRLRMRCGPGDYVFPGEQIGWVEPFHPKAEDRVRDALAVTAVVQSGDPLSFAIQQLVSVGVRALSPGINDPLTAITVADCLGAAFCELAGRALPAGVIRRADEAVLVFRRNTYRDYVEQAFGLIAESATGSPTVMRHLLDVLGSVAAVEPRQDRLEALRKLAARAMEIGRATSSDRLNSEALIAAHQSFLRHAGPTEASRRRTS